MIKKIENAKIRRRGMIKSMGLVAGFAAAALLVEGCTCLHKLTKPLAHLTKRKKIEKVETAFKFRKITKAIVIARNVLRGGITVLGERRISSLNPYYFYGKKWHVLVWERKKDIHYAALTVTHDIGIVKMFNPRAAGKTAIVLIDNALSPTCPYVVLHEKKGKIWTPYSIGISFMQPPFNITDGKALKEIINNYIRIIEVKQNMLTIKIGDSTVFFFPSKKPQALITSIGVGFANEKEKIKSLDASATIKMPGIHITGVPKLMDLE